ncbi:hypothetical protein [Clostridium beijerinckii]|uniref:Uncharacterized protein n=1 Tax=Clostridium beijerinckii TaxID=1520 RepID=A0AAX0BCD7_CLOBE|nr:hypothetical protein [Clostridium beijerinckii]NRT92124.1 hypothetical protein [Clostridium beijerinckii]NYC71652.1 hypothetical protein [Clostridium beijerinckii]
MRYILKNIINNKIGSVIFVIINHCNVFSIILCGALVRESFQLNDELNKRNANITPLSLYFKNNVSAN